VSTVLGNQLWHVHSNIGAIHPKITPFLQQQPARTHAAQNNTHRRETVAAMESARGDSQPGVSANLKQGMKTGTQAERGTPRGPSRPTSKPASTKPIQTNIKACLLPPIRSPAASRCPQARIPVNDLKNWMQHPWRKPVLPCIFHAFLGCRRVWLLAPRRGVGRCVSHFQCGKRSCPPRQRRTSEETSTLQIVIKMH
jgi:hypothetical protein